MHHFEVPFQPRSGNTSNVFISKRQELIKDLDLPEGLFRSLIVDVPETHQVLEHPLVQGTHLDFSPGI